MIQPQAMTAAVPAPPAPPPAPMGLLPLSPDDLAMWKGEITSAREVRQKVEAWWDANIKAYAPSQTGNPDDYGTHINTNRDFTLVERKKADLFYQAPDVSVQPSPLLDAQNALLETHATILNSQLGRTGIDVKATVHRALFDVLCPAGTGWTYMGYESATIDTPITDPTTGQPMTGPDGQAVSAPVPVYEQIFWRWFSPKQALIPKAFRSTHWDDAPWLGVELEVPLRTAKRLWNLPEGFTGRAPSKELHFDHGLQDGAPESVVRAQLLYYRSALYREDIVHPQHLTRLVLVEGLDAPAEHRDAPEQTLDPQGKLTPDSLIGFPFHPLTIRTLSDSAYVPSDCTISRPLVNELNRFREQMVEQRDANTLRWSYNVDTLPTDALSKIVRSPVGGFVGLPGDAFAGEGAIKELPHGTYPRENFQFNDYLDNDLARTHALDAEQAGATANGDQTATEVAVRQSNINARLGLERGNVLDWYLAGVTKYSTLVQRFMPVETAAQIVGGPAAQTWDQWRHTVPAALAFTALPDSTLRQDLAVDRDRALKQYTFFANDPFVNRAAHLKHIFPKLGLPASLIVDQPPAPHPEPAKISLAIASADLMPQSPAYPNIYQILTQQGVQNLVPPMPIAAPMQPGMPLQPSPMTTTAPAGVPPAHGGKVAELESLSKHQSDQTGGMNGTGRVNPIGAGGVQ